MEQQVRIEPQPSVSQRQARGMAGVASGGAKEGRHPGESEACTRGRQRTDERGDCIYHAPIIFGSYAFAEAAVMMRLPGRNNIYWCQGTCDPELVAKCVGDKLLERRGIGLPAETSNSLFSIEAFHPVHAPLDTVGFANRTDRK